MVWTASKWMRSSSGWCARVRRTASTITGWVRTQTSWRRAAASTVRSPTSGSEPVSGAHAYAESSTFIIGTCLTLPSSLLWRDATERGSLAALRLASLPRDAAVQQQPQAVVGEVAEVATDGGARSQLLGWRRESRSGLVRGKRSLRRPTILPGSRAWMLTAFRSQGDTASALRSAASPPRSVTPTLKPRYEDSLV
jgi:hypothetical protein